MTSERDGEPRIGAAPPPSGLVTIREADPQEWQRARALRLEMLADTPHAFGDRLSDAEQWDDERWQTRHASHLVPDSAVFVAVAPGGPWVGQMEVREFRHHDPARAWLLGVYVGPAHRGDGTAAALLREVVSWCRARGFDQLYLDVHQHSRRAQGFYERHGFVRTGRHSPYPLDPTTSEWEMVKALTDPSCPSMAGKSGLDGEQ